MNFDKEEYEKLIIGSSLFSLDKENEKVAFRRESYKMVEYLYCYLLAINREKFEPFGCEITEVATRCINNFDSTKGTFLHYFNAAWKKEYDHIRGNQALEEKYHGIRISQDIKRNLKRYLRYESSLCLNSSQQDSYEAIARLMGCPVEDVYQLAELAGCRTVYFESQRNGENLSNLFEQLSDWDLVEDRVITADSLRDILSSSEKAYLSLQKRQRPIISDMLTIRVCDFISDSRLDTSDYSFISTDIVQKYAKSHTLPTQREIAQKYGKNEASISRTVKEFIQKVKRIIRQGK